MAKELTIDEIVMKAIPEGETCAFKKHYEEERRKELKKRIENLVDKAKQPFQPETEPHFKPNLKYK